MIIHKARLPLRWMLTFGILPSPLKILFYRWRGARIGRGVKLGFGSVILAGEALDIGDHTCIGMFTAIDAAKVKMGKRNAIRSFVLIEAAAIDIGDDVRISETVLIRPFVTSAQARIVVRDRAHIFPFAMIDVTREVHIGEESSVGYGTYIFTHGAYKSKLDGYPVVFDGVHIGKGVWIPSRVFIMPSVRIGDDAVIGTGALVNRDVAAGALAVGMPAKVVKTREEFTVRHSQAEKAQMVEDMLHEFCQYLQDDARWRAQVAKSAGRVAWTLSAPQGKPPPGLELVESAALATDECLSVLLTPVADDVLGGWERTGKMWFCIASKRCSGRLDALGEELREFFRRYGLYFARP